MLSDCQQAKVRAAYGLNLNDPLPRPYGDNPWLQPSNASISPAVALSEAPQLPEIDAAILFTCGSVSTNASAAAGHTSSSASLRPLGLVRKLAMGRCSFALHVRLSDGTDALLKLYHDNGNGPQQFTAEKHAYRLLSAQGLTIPLPGSSYSLTDRLAVHPYGVVRIPESVKVAVQRTNASVEQSDVPQWLPGMLRRCSRGLLLDFLCPNQGWRTLQDAHVANFASCAAALAALESIPLVHGDVLPRNVLVRHVESEARWQAVWIDWASNYPHIVTLNDTDKRKEMARLWSRLFDVLLPLQDLQQQRDSATTPNTNA